PAAPSAPSGRTGGSARRARQPPRSQPRSSAWASRRCASTLVEGVDPLAEHGLRELDPALAELVEEDRAEAGRLEAARDRPVGRHRVDLELEDVLELDDVRLHPEDLGDRD